MSCVATMVSIVVVAAGVAGQRPPPMHYTEEQAQPAFAAEVANDEVAALRQELFASEQERERLLTLTIRSALGLPLRGAGRYLVPTAEEKLRANPQAEASLLDEQVRVTGLTARLEELTRQVSEADKRRQRALTDRRNMTDYVPGSALLPVVQQPDARGTAPAAANPAPRPDVEPARVAEIQSPASSTDDVLSGQLEPVLIRGSRDHTRVGRALYFTGDYEAARDELLVAVKQHPSALDKFYLARCHEQLGDHANADSLYLDIEAADVREVDGKRVVGTWARAARVARRQMEWMQSQGQWQPERSIESIQWRQR